VHPVRACADPPASGSFILSFLRYSACFAASPGAAEAFFSSECSCCCCANRVKKRRLPENACGPALRTSARQAAPICSGEGTDCTRGCLCAEKMLPPQGGAGARGAGRLAPRAGAPAGAPARLRARGTSQTLWPRRNVGPVRACGRSTGHDSPHSAAPAVAPSRPPHRRAAAKRLSIVLLGRRNHPKLFVF